MRNARCVATGHPPFFINSWTINAHCSSNHAMLYSENGTYTAVRRRAPYHSICSHPKLCPSQIGVFFLPHSVSFFNWRSFSVSQSPADKASCDPSTVRVQMFQRRFLSTKAENSFSLQFIRKVCIVATTYFCSSWLWGRRIELNKIAVGVFPFCDRHPFGEKPKALKHRFFFWIKKQQNNSDNTKQCWKCFMEWRI